MCVYIYVPKYSQLSLFSVTCIYVFRATIGKQLVCFFLGKKLLLPLPTFHSFL